MPLPPTTSNLLSSSSRAECDDRSFAIIVSSRANSPNVSQSVCSTTCSTWPPASSGGRSSAAGVLEHAATRAAATEAATM